MEKKPYVISIRFADPGRRRKSTLETCEKTCIDTGEKIKMATGYKLTLNFNSCTINTYLSCETLISYEK